MCVEHASTIFSLGVISYLSISNSFLGICVGDWDPAEVLEGTIILSCFALFIDLVNYIMILPDGV